MSRYLRYSRITFSAFCGLACVLLIVLWIRSYYACDIFTWNYVSGETERGILYLAKSQANIGFVDDTPVSGWKVTELSEVDDEGSLANMMTGRDGTRKIIETMEVPWAKVVAIKMYPLLLLFIALTAVPLVHLSRFSLRTLLIATTTVAVAIGAIVAMRR
jgi:hypothetical protein